MIKSLNILGTRGIPASHGGFETFAEQLSLYLVNNGWEVTVYCQKDGSGSIYHDEWRGVHRVNIPVVKDGAVGTIIFDWKSTLHASTSDSLILTLGYNTALFSIWYRIKNNTNIINMDGIEWKREKWSLLERLWLYLNERAACHIGNHLIADHPEIMNHLKSRVSSSKITMIPYGSEKISTGDVSVLNELGLEPNGYAIVIARPEPENSILEIVSAFSSKKRNIKLVVLGDINKCNPQYKSRIFQVASDEIIFTGAIYTKSRVQCLRYFALFYIHGHQVGGTNPSLVESLGAGNAILAHDNIYNRWVTKNTALYFNSITNCSDNIQLLIDDDMRRNNISEAMSLIHNSKFTWPDILGQYEKLLIASDISD